MYQRLKKLAKTIIPQKFLFKYDFLLRRLIGITYSGNSHHCEICKTNLKCFVKIQSNDLLCPACGSRSRTRRLYHMLLNENALQGNVLHFSPSRSLYRIFKKVSSMVYFSTDFENEFVADYSVDIRKNYFESNFFKTIICYHILEHVPEDLLAIKELFRVLSPNGKCYIQTPFKEGNIYEDDSKTTRLERLEAFGQEDHVRIYSIEGLKERLHQVGFKVNIVTFQPEIEDAFAGYRSPETIIIASKP